MIFLGFLRFIQDFSRNPSLQCSQWRIISKVQGNPNMVSYTTYNILVSER
jgi:hypothetical protein